MIIFLYGEDSYRAKQKLNDIIEGYKNVHKSGLNLVWFDAKEKSFDDLSASFKMNSMFNEKKLFVMKNVFSNAKFQEDFAKEIKKIKESEDIFVVYENEKIDARNKLFKTLLKEAKSQEFALLSLAQARVWLKKEFAKYGAKIEPSAEDALLTFVGNNLWHLAEEAKKLSHFKNGAVIKRQDVELMVRPKIETDIFKTIDALAARNKKQALDFLYKHLEKGDNPLYVLSMIGYQFRNLLLVKELMQKKMPLPAIAKKSGLHPFVVRKSCALCSQFSQDELKKIYQKIYLADCNIKTGKSAPEAALEMLIAQI